MEDPAFVREYDAMEEEFALVDELLRARKEAGLTQAEVAERMATQPSVVARLEAGEDAKDTLLRLPRFKSTLRQLGAGSKSRWCALRNLIPFTLEAKFMEGSSHEHDDLSRIRCSDRV